MLPHLPHISATVWLVFQRSFAGCMFFLPRGRLCSIRNAEARARRFDDALVKPRAEMCSLHQFFGSPAKLATFNLLRRLQKVVCAQFAQFLGRRKAGPYAEHFAFAENSFFRILEQSVRQLVVTWGSPQLRRVMFMEHSSRSESARRVARIFGA